MKQVQNGILAINGGSSSIKFDVYKTGESLEKIISGEIYDLGTQRVVFSVGGSDKEQVSDILLGAIGSKEAVYFLIDWLRKQDFFDALSAIGHRIVYGDHYTKPEIITDEVLDDFKKKISYDSDHLPSELMLIELLRNVFPNLVHVACFDTAFHADMPEVASLIALPRQFIDSGIKRHGFHGISYEYLLEELKRIAPSPKSYSKTVMAHLGGGASMTALLDGKSMDTSMGFTPASGLPMSTRIGDIDPGIAWYLFQNEKCTPEQFQNMVNHQSGLLGVSGLSGDMKELLEHESMNEHAAQAVELFCYQARKCLGSYAAVLGGLDTLVFSGGIGEQSSIIRSRICKDLEFLGIEIDLEKNQKNETIISLDVSKVLVYVIHTDENKMIASSVQRIIGQ